MSSCVLLSNIYTDHVCTLYRNNLQANSAEFRWYIVILFCQKLRKELVSEFFCVKHSWKNPRLLSSRLFIKGFNFVLKFVKSFLCIAKWWKSMERFHFCILIVNDIGKVADNIFYWISCLIYRSCVCDCVAGTINCCTSREKCYNNNDCLGSLIIMLCCSL